MVDISIVNGVYKPTYNWGAQPCTDHSDPFITEPRDTPICLASPSSHRCAEAHPSWALKTGASFYV